jgi:hypothetical protein
LATNHDAVCTEEGTADAPAEPDEANIGLGHQMIPTRSWIVPRFARTAAR